MYKRLKNRRINGRILEQIMRDVLDGMQHLTHQAGRHSRPGKLQILGVEKSPATARDAAKVIPFPRKSGKG
jgi:hypothetical protein